MFIWVHLFLSNFSAYYLLSNVQVVGTLAAYYLMVQDIGREDTLCTSTFGGQLIQNNLTGILNSSRSEF